MQIRLRFHAAVCQTVRTAVRRLVRALVDRGLVRVTTPLTAVFTSSMCVSPCEGQVAFAVYDMDRTTLHVGADLRAWSKAVGTRREGLQAILSSFCHELVHYEQHRDGRPLTERGVEVRARALLRKGLC